MLMPRPLPGTLYILFPLTPPPPVAPEGVLLQKPFFSPYSPLKKTTFLFFMKITNTGAFYERIEGLNKDVCSGINYKLVSHWPPSRFSHGQLHSQALDWLPACVFCCFFGCQTDGVPNHAEACLRELSLEANRHKLEAIFSGGSPEEAYLASICTGHT